MRLESRKGLRLYIKADARWCWPLCDWRAAAADWEAATTASCKEGCGGVCIFSSTDDLHCSAGSWARPCRSPPWRKCRNTTLYLWKQLVCLEKKRLKKPNFFWLPFVAPWLTSTIKHTMKLSAAKANSSIWKSMCWKLKSFNILQTDALGDSTSQDITASRINTMQRKMTAGEKKNINSNPDFTVWCARLEADSILTSGTYSCGREVSCEGSPWWPPQPGRCTGIQRGRTRWRSPCSAGSSPRVSCDWEERT